MTAIAKLLLDVTDVRSNQGKKHFLPDIIAMVLYGIIVGGESWIDIQCICEEREKELKKFLRLENGIPSHDTFQRVFARIIPNELNEVLAKWAESVIGSTENKHIAIDGKTLRKSFDKANEQSAIHTLNAFVVDNLTVIRQEFGYKKDSEITMIPTLLDSLDLNNSIVSIDAIGCQTDIINKIMKKRGDYLIALKANQLNLYNEVIDYFTYAKNTKLEEKSFQVHQTIDKGHGRIENRSYFCLDTSYYPLSYGTAFKGIKSIIQVTRARETSNGRTYEKQYYISSLPCNAIQLGDVIRGHWAIENSLHHVLDVNYCEDDNRTRKDHAPVNFSMLRKCALSLINLRKNEKLTQKKARTRARLDHNYAKMLLIGNTVKEI